MGKFLVEGFRFHEQQDLALYKKEGKEKGMFKFTKPLLQGECEDKALDGFMNVLADDNLKGTILKCWRKNVDGHWDFCIEKEGRQKGSWGGNETAELKARKAQEGDEEELEPLRAVE